MLVSWNWLKQYVRLDMSADELVRRLMMAGINHEGTREVGGDLAIDLEITSNRPDCLGHLGIAREIAVLWQRELTLPAAQPREGRTPTDTLTKVRIDCPDLCLRYTARVIRGAKIGPSPDWMARRLETIGLAPINNAVDISNYVMMECEQPLHAFDMAKLQGPEIIVRRPRPGETIEAIDHHKYELSPEMCIIADAEDAVAIGGVMGGAQTEISPATRDILIEAAEFDPVSIRSTARKLGLHSDSSYRFERRIDPDGVDWASRRCCELILELCGGELAEGVIDVGSPRPPREPIALRLGQLKRILGIDVPVEEVRRILGALGCAEVETGDCKLRIANCKLQVGERAPESRVPSPEPRAPSTQSPIPNPQSLACVIPPSWRRDLTREIDLVEEVARIHGYDQIPEDVSVPMAPSSRTREDRMLEKVRQVLTAAGFDEAMTLSLVDEATAATLSPWTDAPPLQTLMPVLRGADRLRRTLLPSLLAARQTNEALANPEIELFEIAKVYLPPLNSKGGDSGGNGLPCEEKMLALTSGRDYAALKGVVEAVVAALRPAASLEARDAELAFLEPAQSCQLWLGPQRLAYAGQLTAEALHMFDLRAPAVVAEVRLAPLVEAASLVPRYSPLPPYPAVSRDLNLVVDESIRWADVAATVRASSGPYFEALDYRDTYRDPERLGKGKKSLLMTLWLRWAEGTLTNQQADDVRAAIVTACGRQHGAELR